MEAFLTEFGMIRADRTGDTLYMRGLDEDAFLHVTHRGEPGFLAAGFEAASMKDLEALAREEKRRSIRLDGPGGGSLVRLTDPNGFQIEVVAGRVPSSANRASTLRRAAQRRLWERHGSTRSSACARGPSHVKRLGHCVLNVKNFRESEAWYKSRFGLDYF